MVDIREDQFGKIHLVRTAGPYETGRLVLDEEDARLINDLLTRRFDKIDREALAEHLTRRQ